MALVWSLLALSEHYRAYDEDGRRKHGIVTTERIRPVFTLIRFRATVAAGELAA